MESINQNNKANIDHQQYQSSQNQYCATSIAKIDILTPKTMSKVNFQNTNYRLHTDRVKGFKEDLGIE